MSVQLTKDELWSYIKKYGELSASMTREHMAMRLEPLTAEQYGRLDSINREYSRVFGVLFDYCFATKE